MTRSLPSDLVPWPHQDPTRCLEEDWLFVGKDRNSETFESAALQQLLWFGRATGEIRFWRDGVRFFVSHDSGAIQLAGVIVEADDDLQVLQRELTIDGAELTVWACSRYLHAIGRLPGVERIRTLGVRSRVSGTDARLLTRFRGLRSLYFQKTYVANIAVLRALPSLEALLFESCILEDLSPLIQLEQLAWLDLRCRVQPDLAPIRHLTGLKSLWLATAPAQEETEYLLENLRELQSLTLNSAGRLTRLPPLERHPELRSLRIGDCAIGDLSPVRGAAKLQSLTIGSDNLQDLSPLSGHTGLSAIDVSCSDSIRDYSHLAKVPHLTTLAMHGIDDAQLNTVVVACPNLESFGVGSNAVEDASSLSRLQHLKSLGLAVNAKTIGCIAGMRSLRSLEIKVDPEGVDFGPLTQLTDLEELSLPHLTEIPFVARLEHLVSLEMVYSPVADLRPLTGLRSLAFLNLRESCEIRDATPLASLPSLVSVDLSGSAIRRFWDGSGNHHLLGISLPRSAMRDLSLVPTFLRLRELDLSDCEAISDVSPLALAQNLVTVNLSRCPNMRDVAPLAGAKRLRCLILEASDQLEDLSGVGQLTQLTELALPDLQELEDFSPLRNLGNLKYLWLYGCQQLRDLSPLTALGQLETLSLNACPEVSDLSPLARMPTLGYLSLPPIGNPDLSFLEHLPNLMGLGLTDCVDLSDLSPLRPIIARGGIVDVPDRIKPALERLKGECR